jgi:hypothetical protein
MSSSAFLPSAGATDHERALLTCRRSEREAALQPPPVRCQRPNGPCYGSFGAKPFPVRIEPMPEA